MVLSRVVSCRLVAAAGAAHVPRLSLCLDVNRCIHVSLCASLPRSPLVRIQDGWTPLNIAAQQGHEVCVRQLLEAGANIEAAEEVRGWCGAGSGFGARRRVARAHSCTEVMVGEPH